MDLGLLALERLIILITCTNNRRDPHAWFPKFNSSVELYMFGNSWEPLYIPPASLNSQTLHFIVLFL